MKLKLLPTLLIFSLILGASLAYADDSSAVEEIKEEALKLRVTDIVQICTVPLPISKYKNLNRLLINTKHIYLKVNRKTYGTPFTAKQTYMGGEAYLYTEDIFRKANLEDERCYNVRHKASETEEAFAKRTQCIADKLSVLEKKKPQETKKWFPIFDYHFLKNNCGSMANYLLECAGGQAIKKSVNFSVGDRVEAEKEATIGDMSSGELALVPATYGEVCERAVTECEEEAKEILAEENLPL